ncbi:MAG TPA: hypothetical protein PLD51_04970 [Pontiellaceae bacterium]|nr:hypothetical protein [Pontiellaceae bacterium]
MNTIKKILNSFRIDQCSWAPEQEPKKFHVFALLLIFLLFSGLYGLLGWLFMRLGCFSHVDIFFGADARWMVGDIAEFAANHYRTNTHPLGVLLVNPVGTLLNLLVRSPQTTALLITALTGGGFVVLLVVFLLRLCISKTLAVLCAFLGGLSACNLLWSAVPDYFLLDGISLLFFCWVVTAHPHKLWLVVVSAAIAAGTVTTNLPVVVMIYTVARHGIRQKLSVMLRDGIKFFVLILALVTMLAVVQDLIYPSSTLFFRTHALQSRTMYMSSESTIGRFALFVPYLFLFNILFPSVARVSLGAEGLAGIRFPITKLSACTELFTPMGWLFVLLWLVLLGFSLWVCIREKQMAKPLTVLLALCLLFNVALHLFYGRPDEFFLYTPHWTFMVIALLGISLDVISRKFRQVFLAIVIYLLLLVVLLIANNATVIRKILDILE